MLRLNLGIASILALMVPACSNTSASENDTEGGTETSVTDPSSTSVGGTATTTTGTSSSSTSQSTGSESGTDTEEDPDTGTTSLGTDSGSGTETDGAACVGLDQMECEANDRCMVVNGQEIQQGQGFYCLGEFEYLGCLPNTGCDDVITYACDGANVPYQLPSNCIPDDFEICDPPAMPDMGC